ncbi:bisanhydrobacterioruberin hydratase [Anaerolineaceae bacterium]|nr:bisanhydrobacterioruberin hydratase [Anaerolineaceae bacterium]
MRVNLYAMQSSPLELAPADTKRHWLAAQLAEILRDRLVMVSMGIWVLVIVATPIALWTMGQPGLLAALQAGVLTQVVTVLLVLVRAGLLRQALLAGAAVPLLGWLVEVVGQASGFPFGSYQYTPLLQPQLAGVPVLIPLAWLMMMPPAWAMALVIAGAQPGWRARVRRAAVAALAFTAWDLFLDPQMVAWNAWVWAVPGVYFGIPLLNFAGWLLVAFCVSLLLAPGSLPLAPLIMIYAVTCVLQTIGQLLFWQLAGPGVAGLAGMGGMLAWAYARRTIVRVAEPAAN